MKLKFNNLTEEQNREINKEVKRTKDVIAKTVELVSRIHGTEWGEPGNSTLRMMFNRILESVTKAYNKQSDKGSTTTIEFDGKEDLKAGDIVNEDNFTLCDESKEEGLSYKKIEDAYKALEDHIQEKRNKATIKKRSDYAKHKLTKHKDSGLHGVVKLEDVERVLEEFSEKEDHEWEVGDAFKTKPYGIIDKVWEVESDYLKTKVRIRGEKLGWLDVDEIEPYNK